MIDERAYVDSRAKIADNVEIGPWSWIGPGVEIGAGSIIGPHVVIKGRTIIGENNQIMSFSVIGGDPQHLGYRGEETSLIMGNHNVIREHASIHRGTIEGGGKTEIGDHNYLMAYVHVAHDCRVGSHVVFANTSCLGGHVEVDDYVTVGGFTAIHQFCRIGAYSFLGRATKVYRDIPPYMTVVGNPGCPSGVNIVGLKRHNFSKESLRIIKKAFVLIYREGNSLEDVRGLLDDLVKKDGSIGLIVDAFDHTTRGIERHQHRN